LAQEAYPAQDPPPFFGGGAFCPGPEKASEGHPQKVVTVVTVVTFCNVCLLKVVTAPPGQPQKLSQLSLRGVHPNSHHICFFPLSKHPPKHIEAHCHPLKFRPQWFAWVRLGALGPKAGKSPKRISRPTPDDDPPKWLQGEGSGRHPQRRRRR
jgi:hypothetical protein